MRDFPFISKNSPISNVQGEATCEKLAQKLIWRAELLQDPVSDELIGFLIREGVKRPKSFGFVKNTVFDSQIQRNELIGNNREFPSDFPRNMVDFVA